MSEQRGGDVLDRLEDLEVALAAGGDGSTPTRQEGQELIARTGERCGWAPTAPWSRSSVPRQR